MRNVLAFVSSLALCMGVLSLCGQSRIVPVDGSPGGNEANGVIKSTCVSGSPSTCI